MEKLSKLMQEQFDKMWATGKLFKSSVGGRQVWNLYLESFSPENDPVFRDPDSSTHNCQHCNNFIRRYGNVVAVDDDYNIMNMFDIVDQMDAETKAEYGDSFKNISDSLKAAPIANVFFETYAELQSLPYEQCKKNQKVFKLGTAKNHKRYTEEEANKFPGVVKKNETRTFHHLHLDLPSEFVKMSNKSLESIQADYKSAKDVFFRGMCEIPLDTLELVKDLINQGSLLNGETHVGKVTQIIPFKKKFDSIAATNMHKAEIWAWVASYELPYAKFKNELIGVLCTELAEGEELNKACRSWNKRVDPANYMKAVAPITEGQKKIARVFVEENGYIESFDRRLATLDDIKVTEIKHINVGDGSVKKVSMFDNVPTKASRHKRNEFDGVEEVSIDKFMKDILPGCTSVEAYFENRLEGNLVTMTTSKDEDCKKMFKWNNPYSWTYKGNLAGKSMIKEAVETAGGKIDGVLNFRLAWNDGKNRNDDSDLDAWAKQPDRTSIGYSTPYRKDKRNGMTSMTGQLDLDNTSPSGKLAVENITWHQLHKMKDGDYVLWVNQYSDHNSQGFKAEIEFNGEVHEYSYDKPLRYKEDIKVATVTLKNGEFTIKHHLPSSSTSKEIYGLETQKFHKVDLMCTSPNHWGDNKTGNKHYFFMLNGCKADAPVRSFHNENLEPELAQHRKVLEVLGSVNMIEPTEKQLSGIGFNATVRDEVILRLKGNFKRVIKVKF